MKHYVLFSLFGLVAAITTSNVTFAAPARRVLRSMAPGNLNGPVQALEEARYANWRIKTNGLQAEDLVRKAGYRPRNLGLQPGSTSVCIPLRTVRADALKIVEQGKRAAFWL
jgi:hypothetical protein